MYLKLNCKNNENEKTNFITAKEEHGFAKQKYKFIGQFAANSEAVEPSNSGY